MSKNLKTSQEAWHIHWGTIENIKGRAVPGENETDNVNGGSVLFKGLMQSFSEPSNAWTPLNRSLWLQQTTPACSLGCHSANPATFLHCNYCSSLFLCSRAHPEGCLAEKHRLNLPLFLSLQPGIIKRVYYSITFCSFYHAPTKSQFIKWLKKQVN